MEDAKNVIDALEKDAFSGGALLLGETAEVKARVADAFDARAEALEGVEADRKFYDFGVGDRVCGAGEEIGDADRAADGRGQNAEG